MRPLLASQPHTRALGLAGLIVLIAIFVSPLAAQSPGDEPVETYEKVLFYPLAIPELEAEIPETGKLLAATVSSLEASLASQSTEVSIPSGQLQDAVNHVNQVLAYRERMHCEISPVSTGLRPVAQISSEKIDLVDFIADQQTVLIGQIEQIAPAWNFKYTRATSIVFVRIEEVLRDPSGRFSAGQLVTYVRPWGEVTVLGTRFCTAPPSDAPDNDSFGTGARIVLTGLRDLRNPDHLVTHHLGYFKVIDSVVYPPANNPRFAAQTATLVKVREGL